MKNMDDWDVERVDNLVLRVDTKRYLGPHFETGDPELRISLRGRTLSSVEVIMHLFKFCNKDEQGSIVEKAKDMMDDQRESRIERIESDVSRIKAWMEHLMQHKAFRDAVYNIVDEAAEPAKSKGPTCTK